MIVRYRVTYVLLSYSGVTIKSIFIKMVNLYRLSLGLSVDLWRPIFFHLPIYLVFTMYIFIKKNLVLHCRIGIN